MGRGFQIDKTPGDPGFFVSEAGVTKPGSRSRGQVYHRTIPLICRPAQSDPPS